MEHKTWMCLICGWIYDEAEGDPEHVKKTLRWWRSERLDSPSKNFAVTFSRPVRLVFS
jgi:hypothetical protein